MRYIILNNKISENEIKSRRKLIEKATGVYFSVKKNCEGIEFNSFPSTIHDCVILVGHNNKIYNYLKYNKIKENNIVIISCFFKINKSILKGKKVFVSYGADKKTYYYDGEEWNLDFLVSKEELEILNNEGEMMDRIRKSFRRLKHGESI